MAAPRSLVGRMRTRELKHALSQIDNNSTRSVTLNNPFIPRKNPETNRWVPPRYSLRRQADLVKKARLEGTLHLLPPGPKLSLAEILAAQQSNLEEQKGPKGKGKENSQEDGESFTIDWRGEVRERTPAGADVGNRLYAAKKRMFKGHKWERVFNRKRKYRHILMRDMPKRIWQWRQRRVLRKPDPFSEPRMKAKDSQKLPF